MQEEEPQLISTEDAEPVIHNIENSSNEEGETDSQEGGLEVSPGICFRKQLNQRKKKLN